MVKNIIQAVKMNNIYWKF